MIKKLFTFIIVIFPILGAYITPIPSITISDMLLLAIIPFIIIEMFKDRKKIKLNMGMGIIFLYTLIQLLVITIFCDSEYVDKLLLPTVRLIVYFGIIALFSKSYFDIELGKRLLKIFAMFATYFLIIQVIFFYIFHIYIPGNIPGLQEPKVMELYNNAMENATSGRLRSIFLEPSAYAMYVALALGIELFKEEKNDKKAILILTLGLLLSASSTGVIMVAIMYIIYIFKNLSKLSKKAVRRLIALFFIAIVILTIFMQTQAFKIFYNRTFVDKGAVKGRFGSYGVVLEGLNNINLVFGRGIFKMNIYIPTIPRIFLYYGIIGAIFFIAVSIRNFIKLKGIQWIVWLILFVLMFPTEIFFGKYVLLYIPFMNEIKGENEYETKHSLL